MQLNLIICSVKTHKLSHALAHLSLDIMQQPKAVELELWKDIKSTVGIKSAAQCLTSTKGSMCSMSAWVLLMMNWLTHAMA